jgi:cellulose synthase/poly-beta-1,6-N-acetylglucosamine synthase-like glycosyltransferase
MSLFHTLIPILYQGAGALLIFYGLFILSSLTLFWLHRGRRDWPTQNVDAEIAEWPPVTVQIPIYNEPRVARRVVKAVAALDYPQDKLQIQVLDDSTDRTTPILASLVARLRRAHGLNIQHLHRHERRGYKAGALADALPRATGDFIAIFDADFVPEPDWLRRTLPALLHNPQLAFVQTRWGHINRSQNPLTAAQGLALDGHFVIEQQARSASGFMQNFNGSGGVWRKAAIAAVGGWTSDTVTEDLDLSYRAQLAGWRGSYLNHVEAPAEVPPLLVSFKRQQRRWAKGSAQTLRKLAGPILHSQHSWPKRLYALLHLGGYATHLPLLALLFLTLPLALIPHFSLPLPFIGYISMFVSVAPFVMYGLSQQQLAGRRGLKRLWVLPVLALISLGLSPMMGRAVWDGLWHRGGAFERTPKQGKGPRRLAMPEGESLRQLLPEATVLAYALVTMVVIAVRGQWALALLPLLFILGTSLVLFIGLSEYQMAISAAPRTGRFTRPSVSATSPSD